MEDQRGKNKGSALQEASDKPDKPKQGAQPLVENERPIKGALYNESPELEAQARHAAEKELLVHQRAVGEAMNASDGDGAIAGGHMKTGEAASKQSAGEGSEREKKKSKERKFKDMLHMLGLTDNWLGLDLDDPSDLPRALDEIQGLIDKVDTLIEALENGEDVLDENGELKDKELEAAMRKWEEAHPDQPKIDRSNPESLLKFEENLVKLNTQLRAAQSEHDQRFEKASSSEEALEGGNQTADALSREDRINVVSNSQLSEKAKLDVISSGVLNPEKSVSVAKEIGEKSSFEVTPIKPAFNQAASGAEPSFDVAVTPQGNAPRFDC